MRFKIPSVTMQYLADKRHFMDYDDAHCPGQLVSDSDPAMPSASPSAKPSARSSAMPSARSSARPFAMPSARPSVMRFARPSTRLSALRSVAVERSNTAELLPTDKTRLEATVTSRPVTSWRTMKDVDDDKSKGKRQKRKGALENRAISTRYMRLAKSMLGEYSPRRFRRPTRDELESTWLYAERWRSFKETKHHACVQCRGELHLQSDLREASEKAAHSVLSILIPGLLSWHQSSSLPTDLEQKITDLQCFSLNASTRLKTRHTSIVKAW